MTNANNDKPSAKEILISITIWGLAFMTLGFSIGFILGHVLGYDMGRLDGFKMGVEAAAEYILEFKTPEIHPPIENRGDKEL